MHHTRMGDKNQNQHTKKQIRIHQNPRNNIMNIAQTTLTNLETDPYAARIDGSLMIYKKSQRETYKSICNLPTPAPTRTHQPIAHDTLINLTAESIINRDWVITGSTYASSYEQGNAHFVFELEHDIIPGVRMQIAGHNSHIKMRSAILYMQTHTRSCTNMDAPAEVPLKRRHTPRILQELPQLISAALYKLDAASESHKHRLISYQNQEISDQEASHLMIRALEKEIIPCTYMPALVNEWREPQLDEFFERNMYSLYNCFTETFKKSPADTPNRSQKLINLLDDTLLPSDIQSDNL